MTVVFGQEQEQLLEKLANSYGLSKVAILRAGLSLFIIANKEAERGNAIGVVNGERVVKEIAGAWSSKELVTA